MALIYTTSAASNLAIIAIILIANAVKGQQTINFPADDGLDATKSASAVPASTTTTANTVPASSTAAASPALPPPSPSTAAGGSPPPPPPPPPSTTAIVGS